MLVFSWLATAALLSAQQPDVHYLHQGAMPPGAIGSRQLERGGPLPGFYQPVEIKVPQGALISMAVDHQFEDEKPAPRKVGLLIGAVYRIRVTNIRMAEGVEVFPTIEIVDRLYAPAGQKQRFAIPVDITEEDLRLAAEGKFVTRVIYLEDPLHALPAREDPKAQNWFEVRPGQDPLAVADGLGRAVAILRMGARIPTQGEMQDEGFFIGSPPFEAYPRDKSEPPRVIPQRPQTPKAEKPPENAPKGSPFQDETPKTNALRAEVFKDGKYQEKELNVNVLRKEAPKADVLPQDALKTEKAEKTELPKEEVPKAEVPERNPSKDKKAEPPQEEAPKTDLPKVDASKKETLKTAKAKRPRNDVHKAAVLPKETLKAKLPQQETPKVNILPPPPEVEAPNEEAGNSTPSGDQPLVQNGRRAGT
jgi:hypothetical protein